MSYRDGFFLPFCFSLVCLPCFRSCFSSFSLNYCYSREFKASMITANSFKEVKSFVVVCRPGTHRSMWQLLSITRKQCGCCWRQEQRVASATTWAPPAFSSIIKALPHLFGFFRPAHICEFILFSREVSNRTLYSLLNILTVFISDKITDRKWDYFWLLQQQGALIFTSCLCVCAGWSNSAGPGQRTEQPRCGSAPDQSSTGNTEITACHFNSLMHFSIFCEKCERHPMWRFILWERLWTDAHIQ